MKLLVVSSSFPMRLGDGLSPFIWEYCLHLKKRGWDITVIVPHHKGLEREDIWDGIRIKRFKYLPQRLEDMAYSGGIIPGVKEKPWKIIKVPFFMYSMYKQTLTSIVSGDFDIVNFHWLFPACFWVGRFVRRSGFPIVLTGHGTDVHLALKKPFSIFAAAGLRRSAGLTLNSQYMKGLLGEFDLPGRTEIIPMGVDTEKFHPGSRKPSQSNKIMFLGRLIEQKGVDVLIDAFSSVLKAVPEAELEIIGYGPERDALVRKIRESRMQDSVSLCDRVSYDELPERYGGARVLVLPSLIPEGLGMTAVEAAACGIPTVTFGLGGTSELVVDGETGLVVEQGKESLAESLISILTDDDLADRLGENARRKVAGQYSWDVLSTKFDRLFREIVRDRAKANGTS
jgi:glycosyltransferase involved in cell wall biosynthesis